MVLVPISLGYLGFRKILFCLSMIFVVDLIKAERHDKVEKFPGLQVQDLQEFTILDVNFDFLLLFCHYIPIGFCFVVNFCLCFVFPMNYYLLATFWPLLRNFKLFDLSFTFILPRILIFFSHFIAIGFCLCR